MRLLMMACLPLSLAACAAPVRDAAAPAAHLNVIEVPAVGRDQETAAWWFRAGAAAAAGNGAMQGTREERHRVPRRRHEPDHGRRRAHPRRPAQGRQRRGEPARLGTLSRYRTQQDLQHRCADARFGRHDDRDRQRREDARRRARRRPATAARRLRRRARRADADADGACEKCRPRHRRGHDDAHHPRHAGGDVRPFARAQLGERHAIARRRTRAGLHRYRATARRPARSATAPMSCSAAAACIS